MIDEKLSDDEQFVSFDIKDMYPSSLKHDVLSEIKNRINDNNFVTSIDKRALIELAIFFLEFMLFTDDKKILQLRTRLIHRCTNFTMFYRTLYLKSGRKSHLSNVKCPSSMVQKS